MKEEQLKILIMNAHMAGQHNAGVDASNYEALVYYNSLVAEECINNVGDKERKKCHMMDEQCSYRSDDIYCDRMMCDIH